MAKRKAESTDLFYSEELDDSDSSTQSDLEDSDYENSCEDGSDIEFSLSEDEEEANSEPIEPLDVPWVENGIPRPPFPYTDREGAQVPINIQDPVDIFELFFDDSIINLISEETNRYATQFIVHHGQKLKPKSRVRKWKNTSPNEIRTFLGLTVLQSVCSKPSFDMYFSARESTYRNAIFRENHAGI
ncbi:unnamed protein product [Acanthoscelides obtectus]|uniref:PiggyBac transposable element-derived protein domain-containing protein n=1 Tax=Acanthoscelides obtectus TaxID=200917 RepID=A0A9P0Q8E8_ACAOB|nr:unnamed protein product [Acanthoscelides obtectus]CAK1687825.1 PiggyBac transposable element-derived protein 4 [Acanthoscelides obtectus]